ncbi:MAG: geranylgeranyl reductase family protein [Candidatus Heimdallarchaeota archaeon]
MYDVVVSGAGPAGSKAAEVIAKAGYKVALLEKNKSWRKPCGGAVSSRIFKYYPQLSKSKYPPITGITMYSADFHKFTYSWKGIRESSIVVDRLEFDNFIQDVAIDAGAEFFDKNISVDFIIKNKQKVGIKAKTPMGIKEYFGKIFIVADGMSSKLANKSGLRDKWKIEDIGVCKCAIMEGENNIDKESMSIFYKSFKGYSWLAPLDEKRFNIGCGTWQEDNLSYDINKIFSEFLNNSFLKNFLPLERYNVIWEAGYPLPARGVVDKALYGDNIMLIGDAAGFVSPISGEGIHPSIVSGQAAAETAINALEIEDFSSKALKNYKNYPNIKKIIRNFKMRLPMIDFFFENMGRNLSKMFELAEKDDDFSKQIVDMFLFNQAPSREFLAKIREN